MERERSAAAAMLGLPGFVVLAVSDYDGELACGGAVGDVRLLSEAGCARVLKPQADGDDLVMSLSMCWGLGYCIGSPLVGEIYGERARGRRLAFWGGSGGSWAFNDLDARMTVAYVMNAQIDGAFDQRSIATGTRPTTPHTSEIAEGAVGRRHVRPSSAAAMIRFEQHLRPPT